PQVCRFKTWLLTQASWRIKDQLRKRHRNQELAGRATAQPKDDSTRTDTIHRVPDPASVDLEALFDTQWRQSLLTLALERVKERFSLKQFQVFDLLVTKEWPAADVAKALGISVANVYVTRHRISAAIAKEIKGLEKELERKVASRAGAAPRE